MARRLRSRALVTGDSLGQVSSQTLTNITALDDAVTLPILRPLIGLDKNEIIAEARRISTLAISELPDQDCCSLLAPRQAETRAKIEDLRRIEAGWTPASWPRSWLTPRRSTLPAGPDVRRGPAAPMPPIACIAFRRTAWRNAVRWHCADRMSTAGAGAGVSGSAEFGPYLRGAH